MCLLIGAVSQLSDVAHGPLVLVHLNDWGDLLLCIGAVVVGHASLLPGMVQTN